MVLETLVGTILEPKVLKVTEELTVRYAQAVNDLNPRYLDVDRSGGVMAPPLFGIVPAMHLMREAMAEGVLPIPMERSVHGEQDMWFASPIAPGDVLISEGEITSTAERSTGSTLDIHVHTSTDEGDERVRQLITMFIRNRDRERAEVEPAPLRESPLVEASMSVASDQSLRYAEASLTQGIAPHEDHAFARALGYRTMFLQGQCTMAFAAKAIVDTVAGGDPSLVRRLRVRFADVVYPGDVVATSVWRTGEDPGRYMFESVNQDGAIVLADGLAEIRT